MGSRWIKKRVAKEETLGQIKDFERCEEQADLLRWDV
jgi:hypothetical protein